MSDGQKASASADRQVGRGPVPGFGGPGGPGGFGMVVQKPKNAKRTLLRLLRYFGRFKFRITLVFVAAVASTLFTIVTPNLLGDATTDLAAGFVNKLRGLPGAGIDFAKILHLLVLLGALYLFSSVFSWVQQYIMAGVAQRMVFNLRKEANDKLAKLPVSYFDSHAHGDILSRFVNDFDNISSTMQQSLTQAIQAIITFVGVIIMMLTISWIMTVAVALTLPLSLVVTRAIAKRSQQYFVTRQRRLGELNGHVEEMYTGHAIVKAFGHEDESIAAFAKINERLYDSTWRAQFITGIIMPVMNFIGNIGYVLVCVIGGVLVTKGAIKIGAILAFIQYSRLFTQPITQLSSISNVIQSTLASSERVFEIIDEREDLPESSVPETLIDPQGDVVFEQVEFSYKPDVPLIEQLDIQARSGQTVAIVGPTGAGKTTLVNLLMRFYELSGGRILVDGIDIAHMRRESLRELFGMVLQDTWLFHGTIRDNIAYGREGASETDVIEAARAAFADHFIRTLPDGYDTVLNEEASNLSQGQKQLLTIARAILADPKILILDEATSSVDTRTEAHIQTAMKRLMKGRTSFVIAHRLSTIREADLILVMQHGRVVEQGTHEGLLRKGGFYADLYNSQFSHEEAMSAVAVG